MKKYIIAAILMVASSLAFADEITVGGDRNFSQHKSAADVTFATNRLGPMKAEFGVSKSDASNFKNTQLSAGVVVEVAKLGPIQVAAKVAGVYVNPDVGTAGYGVRYGVEAGLPVTKSFAVVASATRLDTQDRVRTFNGNTVGVGARFAF